MNCSNCGNILQPGEKFCNICGEKVSMDPGQNMGGQPGGGPVNIVWTPQGQMPDMNQTPDMGQMPGMNQAPDMNQMPGMNQAPDMGQMPGMNQTPNMNQMPDMDQMPDFSQFPGMEKANPQFAKMAGMAPNMGMQNNMRGPRPGAPTDNTKTVLIGGLAVLAVAAIGFGCYKFLPSMTQHSDPQGNEQPVQGNGNNGGTGSQDPINQGSFDNSGTASSETGGSTGSGNMAGNGSGSGSGNVAPVDMSKQGTQNRQEGTTIYVVDGGLYNDKGSYNMDFYKEDGYLRSSFAKANSAMTIVDNDALYYVNAALDVEVEAVDIDYGGICYNGNALYYVTGYSNEDQSLYIVDKNEKKKYKIDDEVMGSDLMMSPNGTKIAYTKYDDDGFNLYVAGIDMEPKMVYKGFCDVYCLSDEGQLIYGAAPEDDDDKYSMYCFRGTDSNKKIGDIKPSKIYTTEDFETVMIRTRSDYNLYYFNQRMDKVKQVCDQEVTEVFTGALSQELGYMVEIIPAPTLAGLAYGSSSMGTYIFTNADDEPIKLSDSFSYSLSCFYTDDCQYYAFVESDHDSISKYEYQSGQGLEILENYKVEGYIGDISTSIDLGSIWYCNRDGQLWVIDNNGQRMLTDGVDFSYTYSTFYNFAEKSVYFVKDGHLWSADKDGNVKDTGCECANIYNSYKTEYATCFEDSNDKKYLYIGGRVIPE